MGMIMIRILFFFLLIFSCQVSYAQMNVLDAYPNNQFFYE